jgi:hypothetical protein
MRRMPASKTETSARKLPSNVWQPGQSGNPRGRPRAPFDIAAMCREHAPEAVATLVAALKRPKDAIPAAIALLDRGFGRPKQMIETNDPAAPFLLHLLAAQHVSQELIAALERREERAISGQADPANEKAEPAAIDVLTAPLPLE